MGYQRLRWITIVVPALFLGAFEFVRHGLLQVELSLWAGTALVVVAVLLSSYVFSTLVFGVIARLQADLVRRNEKLRALNRAGLAVTSDLALEAVLQRIVELSRELVGARYSALGVRGPSGELGQLFTAGLDEATRRRIGPIPRGRGLLGAVLAGGQAIRVPNIARDPRSVGFPPYHPRMTSFLGVPLVKGGMVIGTLYQTDKLGPGGAPVPFSEEDEQLLAFFAAQATVAIENARLYAAAARRERDALALYQAGTDLSALLDTERITAVAASKARELLGAEVAGVSLLEPDGVALAWRLLLGGSDRFRDLRLGLGEGIAGHVVRSGSPLVISDWEQRSAGGPEEAPILELEGLRSALAVPLRSGGRVFGVLMVANRAPATFSDDQVVLLSSLANQAAVALENARLYEKVRSLAVLEERERIAREMHDGLAQVLGYVNTKTLAVARLLEVGKLAEARVQLAQLEAAAKEVYADVREAILGLRTSFDPGQTFLAALRGYLEGFEQQNGIPVELRAPASEADLRLPVAAEIQLLRIVQEALANIRKHARASRAAVRLDADESCVRLLVEDDGQGFDPIDLAAQGSPRFGLQTMRERAEAIGASFALDARPGAGTRVAVTIPRVHHREVDYATNARSAG